MGDIVQGVEHLPEIYKILGSTSSNTKAGRGDNYNKVSKEDIQDRTGEGSELTGNMAI